MVDGRLYNHIPRPGNYSRAREPAAWHGLFSGCYLADEQAVFALIDPAGGRFVLVLKSSLGAEQLRTLQAAAEVTDLLRDVPNPNAIA